MRDDVHRHLPPQLGQCETALRGARLRLTRAYLVSDGDIGGAPRGGTRPTFARETQTTSQLELPPRRF